MLSRKEEKELLIKVGEGDREARNKLVEENLGLVGAVAKKYTRGKFSYKTLFQRGSLGLINAIDNYDLEKGGRLSTYATHYIRGYIIRLTHENRTAVRLPRTYWEQWGKIKDAKKKLGTDDFDALSKEVGISKKRIKTVIKGLNDFGKPVSLNNKEYSLGEERELGDIIAGDFNVERKIVKEETYGKLYRAIEDLSDKEKTVIKSYYGIGCPDRTQSEIAKEIGVSQGHVSRLVKKKIPNKLRKLIS